MPRYVAKRFRFQNGEHHSVLKGPNGLPVHAVTLFLQKFRKRGRAANTIHAVCQCLALLYRELDAKPRIHLLGRLRDGQFLTVSELARLADVAQYPMKALAHEEEQEATPQVVNLNSVRMRRSKAADEVAAVGKANHANRMRYMADYLGFLASYYAAGLPRQQRQQLNLESAEALKTFKAQIPKVTKRAQMDAREGLSKEDQDRLLRVVHPESPENPWERGFVRHRNWVIVMLLLATGMRSGELLGLQISDIKQQLSKLGVLRRADASEDTRRTPVGTKTNDRELELLPGIMRALLAHIHLERHRIRAARRHPQVFVAQDGKLFISLRQRWKHGMKKPQEVGSRISKEALEARKEKLPSAAALRALAGIFHQAVEPPDVMTSSMTAVMLCAPERINEVLRLRRNCLVEGDGEFRGKLGLRWAGSKGFENTTKWLPSDMTGVAREAVDNLIRVSAPAHELATWYTANPTTLFLHEGAVHLRGQRVLTLSDLALVLWGDEGAKNQANTWANGNELEKQPLEGRRIGYLFEDVERAILSMLPATFPFVPGAADLRCMDAIAVMRTNEMHASRATYLCMFSCVDNEAITSRLGTREGRGSIFESFGYTEDEHIVTYISESAEFEGIGTVKARRLWERFGETLYGLLDAGDPAPFQELLTVDAARKLVDAWAAQGESRTLQWLQSCGFSVPLGRKVLRYFGDEARNCIEADPYRLLSFAGRWSTVDRLAMEQFGVAACDPRRLRGAVEEACYRRFAAGHTAMLSADLMDHVTPLLGRPPAGLRWRDVLAAAVSEGLKNGHIVQTTHGLQPLGALVMERQVAQALRDRLAGTGQSLLQAGEVERHIAACEEEDGIELNPEQRQAIRIAAQHSFACLTGGAGVGKTTVLKSLYRIYEATGTKVLQVALAGRAAKRMQEATGLPAFTIASFLKGVNEATFDGPSVLVIDEASMVDIVSMSRLCQALLPHVRLVMVGDPYQLMPVGPGLVLHCVMGLSQVPVVELKTVKRYGGEIAAVAAAFRAGKWPTISGDETSPVAFLPCENRLIAETVVELYALDPQGAQVLAPLRSGPAGTKLLNELCQQRFTASKQAATLWNVEFDQIQRCGFHLGDQVLCTRNLWDQGLQNGSQGRITEVEPEPEGPDNQADRVLAWVEWDDGVRRALTLEMLADVELGFAITVHKAQGSQWRRIIIPVTDTRLLDRTLLYTALTRAQAQVILVGDIDAARRAILAPPRAHTRQVGLDLTMERLLREVEY